MDTIDCTYENEEGEEVVFTLPAKMEVCGECGGHGYVLREGMRGHAYSMEEFLEAFDEEDQEEYFRRGGKYDQVCPCYHGKNVVPVVNESALTPDQKLQYQEYQEHQSEMDRIDSEMRAYERMERLMGC
jgi:hypothetical protein